MDCKKEKNQHKFGCKNLHDKIKTPKSWETAIHKTSEQKITTAAAKQKEKKNTRKIKKKKPKKQKNKNKTVIKPTKQQLEQRMGQKKTGRGASGSSLKTSRRRV
jgi:hypothetical protein